MGGVPVARARLAVFLAAAGVLAVDLLTKAIIRAFLQPYESVQVIPGALWLTHIQNEGAAFGMLQGGRWLFVGVAALVLVGVFLYVRSSVDLSPWAVAALGSISGGSLGNMHDRVVLGSVTDFVDLGWFPVFNVADSAVVVGTGIVVLAVLLGRAEAPGEQDALP